MDEPWLFLQPRCIKLCPEPEEEESEDEDPPEPDGGFAIRKNVTVSEAGS